MQVVAGGLGGWRSRILGEILVLVMARTGDGDARGCR